MVALSPVDNSNLLGTVTDDPALAGNLGEIISSIIAPGSSVSLSTGTAKNITSIILSAGDWDVWGGVCFNHAATTTVNDVQVSIGSTSATIDPSAGRYAALPMFGLVPASYLTVSSICIPGFTLQITSGGTPTIYLVATADFAVSTMTAYGAIYARRRR